jgi:hypothetical protein
MFSLAFVSAACSQGAAPLAPSSVEQLSDASRSGDPTRLSTTSRSVNTYPLVNGSFTLTLHADDGSVGTVTGTYTGEAIVAEHGTRTATLDLQTTGASGIGSTITAIAAEGSREFVDEGEFVLSLTLTSSLTKSPLRATVRGTSRLSCGSSHLIVVHMHGTDSVRGFLEITMDLQHEVERTGCNAPTA